MTTVSTRRNGGVHHTPPTHRPQHPPPKKQAKKHPNPSPAPAAGHVHHPGKMTIVAEGVAPFVVPFAPIDVTLSGIADTFGSVDRPGLDPLLLRSGDGSPTVTFDLFFGYRDPQISVEPLLARMRALARSGKRMRINLDPSTTGLWRLTDFSQQTAGRQKGTNLPTRAVCSLTFQLASDMVVAVGPTSGGKHDQPKKKHPKFHVVQKGETLHSIANKFYGTPSAWKKIADANKLRHAKIHPGQKLRLP